MTPPADVEPPAPRDGEFVQSLESGLAVIRAFDEDLQRSGKGG